MNDYSTVGTNQYPYWKNEFDKEFGPLDVWYWEKGWKKNEMDLADSYRVFMILCNNKTENESRMDILNKLKKATAENPIEYQNEKFWTEQK